MMLNLHRLKEMKHFQMKHLRQNDFSLPSEKKSTLHGKYLLPRGQNASLVEMILFQKQMYVQKKQTVSKKNASFVKMADRPLHVSGPLNRYH